MALALVGLGVIDVLCTAIHAAVVVVLTVVTTRRTVLRVVAVKRTMMSVPLSASKGNLLWGESMLQRLLCRRCVATNMWWYVHGL